MSEKHNSIWRELVRRYQRVEKTFPSAAELERQIEAVQPEPLTENEIDAIVHAVSSGESHASEPEPLFDWLADVDTSSVEEGVLQLNRNKGDSDEEIKKRMDEFRKKALEEHDDDENDLESD
ncbi:hypothetical protein [Aeoliella mucimassa]|uniref:Uncharacterized protein n=1 Tax=Aeoliella mucimassa TaxID=2527972 RepID=A0A518AS24_9BACT|nr:hypothetical protein [Aeoliella mucimassa]QDU57529.1 hypothetical protein Pan181_37470 [Aeoliella mucimassa]